MLVVLIIYSKVMGRPTNEDKYLKAFGKHLAAMRDDRDISQERLAALAGVSRETIGLMERGKRWARLSTLHKVAKSLGVSTEKLFEGLKQ